MAENRRLTKEELRALIEEIEEILLLGEWSSGNVDKMGGIREHIAALEQENKRLRRTPITIELLGWTKYRVTPADARTDAYMRDGMTILRVQVKDGDTVTVVLAGGKAIRLSGRAVVDMDAHGGISLARAETGSTIATELNMLSGVQKHAGETIKRLLAHITALEADNTALRAVLRELTKPEDAGMAHDDWAVYCTYCGDFGEERRYHNHTDACPIVRGRALLKGDSDE